MVTLQVQYEQYPLLKNRRSVCIPNKKYSKLIGIHNLGQHPNFFFAFNITWTTDTSALKYICHLNIIVFFKGGGDIQRSFVLYLKETKRKIVDHSKQFVAICLFETFACPQTLGDLFRISGIQFQVCKVFATCNIWNLKCEVFYWSVSI